MGDEIETGPSHGSTSFDEMEVSDFSSSSGGLATIYNFCTILPHHSTSSASLKLMLGTGSTLRRQNEALYLVCGVDLIVTHAWRYKSSLVPASHILRCIEL